jgi:multidrug efflux pump
VGLAACGETQPAASHATAPPEVSIVTVSARSVALQGLSKDVYFTIGLITIIGLSAKNAILIIEFAKELRGQSRPLVEATVEAAQLRLRPILMTSLAFILGVVPLVIATGASAKSQHALGMGVLGGMITGTVLAMFMVPIFFVTVMNFVSREPAPRPEIAESGRDAIEEDTKPAADAAR